MNKVKRVINFLERKVPYTSECQAMIELLKEIDTDEYDFLDCIREADYMLHLAFKKRDAFKEKIENDSAHHSIMISLKCAIDDTNVIQKEAEEL